MGIAPPQLRRGGPKGRGGAGQEIDFVEQTTHRFAEPSLAKEGNLDFTESRCAKPRPAQERLPLSNGLFLQSRRALERAFRILADEFKDLSAWNPL